MVQPDSEQQVWLVLKAQLGRLGQLDFKAQQELAQPELLVLLALLD
jgi:hypothetical protein